MNAVPSVFEDAIESLGFSRQGTIAEAANVPDDRWDYRPHPNARTVSELVKHIIQSAATLVGEASASDGDFQRRSPEEHVRAHAGEGRMATAIRRFDGGQWTRVTYVFYASSHEDYHRGQLAI